MSKFMNTTSMSPVHPAFSVTVSGDIGDYEQGEVLTKPMAIADYFRTGYNETEPEYPGDDAEIVAIAMSIPYVETDGEVHGSSDWEMQVHEAMHNKAKASDRAPAVLLDVSITKNQSVYDVADMFAKSKEFADSLHYAAYSSETVKISPLKLLLSILKVYNIEVDSYGMVEGIEKCPLFDGMPHPESEPSSKYLEDNNNKILPADRKKFAKYKTEDGKVFDYYRTFIERQPEGKEIAAMIDDLNKGKPAKGKTTSGPYHNRSDTWIDNQLRLWKGREQGAIKYVKMAVAAMYQWRDILTHFKGIGVRFEMDETGSPKSRIAEGYCTLKIYDKIAASKGDSIAAVLTISGFNQLDLDRALEEGGTFTALKNSTKREKKPADAFNLDLEEKGLKRFIDILPELNHWIHKRGTVAEIMAAGNTKAKGEDAELGFDRAANDLVIQFVEMYRKLTPVYNMWAGERMQKLEVKRGNEEKEATDQAVKHADNAA